MLQYKLYLLAKFIMESISLYIEGLISYNKQCWELQNDTKILQNDNGLLCGF